MTRRRRRHRAVGARAGRARCTRTGGWRRPSAPPPTCGRWARCSSAPCRATPRTPRTSVAELVQMVCAEPPAFAEDCGALRPVVESLMRQDPTERPDFEELRGWLRSLVRSAPEPDVGWHTVTAPPSLEPGRPSDPRRLPILRRRGELVRRRRATAPRRRSGAAHRLDRTQAAQAGAAAGRRREPEPGAPRGRSAAERSERRSARSRSVRPTGAPRRLNAHASPGGEQPAQSGAAAVGLVLLGLTAAVLYAMWFMPDGGRTRRTSSAARSAARSRPPAPGDGGKGDGGGTDGGAAEARPESRRTDPADGQGPEGLQAQPRPRRLPDRRARGVGPPLDERPRPGPLQRRRGRDGGRQRPGQHGEVRQGPDGLPERRRAGAGRRTAPRTGRSTSGLRRIDVGDTAMAEGTFSWRDGGRDRCTRATAR